jgi:hypothetical protein
LALLGRAASVVAVTTTVALTYGIGRRLCDRAAGRWAAGFAATAYPLVYYAHTTNLDAMYAFWLILALWSAVVVAQESDRIWAWALLGVGAAMAFLRRSGAAFLPLPVLAIVWACTRRARRSRGGGRGGRIWNRRRWRSRPSGQSVANNVLLNPRLRAGLYLAGRPVPGVTARLAPVEFGLFKGVEKEREYVGQLFDALESSLGWPLLAVAGIGALWLVWRRRRAAAFLLLPSLVHYYVSLRTLDLITLRYTLPLLGRGAAVCAEALRVVAPRGAGAVVGLACSACPCGQVDLLLRSTAATRPRHGSPATLHRRAPSRSIRSRRTAAAARHDGARGAVAATLWRDRRATPRPSCSARRQQYYLAAGIQTGARAHAARAGSRQSVARPRPTPAIGRWRPSVKPVAATAYHQSLPADHRVRAWVNL